MELRRFKKADTKALCDIYYDTIHNVNCVDYTRDELEAWAPSNAYDEQSHEKDAKRWHKIMPFVVAQHGGAIGFAELLEDGRINCFFVHHEHHGKGVGKMLLKACEEEARRLTYERLSAQVSITAKPFFEKMGFCVVKPVLCDIKGLMMKFYDMEKDVE